VVGLCGPAARAQAPPVLPRFLPDPSTIPTGPDLDAGLMPVRAAVAPPPTPFSGSRDPVANTNALLLSVGSVGVSPELPPPAVAPVGLPEPYFVPDRLLDPPELPPLGWFAEADASLLLMHIERQSFTASSIPPLAAGFAGNGSKGGLNGLPQAYVPQAHLNPLVSPRLQVGYRLPAGFGEVTLTYRFMATSGDQDFVNNNGPSNLRGRFNFNTVDLDYASHEMSLWTWADMRWHLGCRFANIYFDDHLVSGLALTPAGDGVADQRFTNYFYGFGPVFGLQLSGHLHDETLTWLLRIDGNWTFGRVAQSYSQLGPATDAAGFPVGFKAPFSTSADATSLNVQAGLRWRARPCLDFFAGYQFEYWWNVGRIVLLGSTGEFYDQGIVFRASYRW
jgi:hypothetical protein